MKRIASIVLTVMLLISMSTFLSAVAEQASAEPVVLTCFIDHDWYWTDKFEGIIPEAITEKTGVVLDITRAIDDKQLGLMIASGDLPDLVYTYFGKDRLSDPNLCYAYSDLIPQYVPEWEPDPIRVANAKAFSPDDKYYFIVNNFNTEEEWQSYPGTPMVPTLGYRADILEELGNPPMNTLEEFEAVLGMVKEKYPDKIPLSTSVNHISWRMMCFRVWMGIGNSQFVENEDGSISYFLNHPNYKEYCAFINSLYRKGYIEADNFSLTEADTRNYPQNALSFAHAFCSQGELYRFGEMAKAVEPNARIMESKPLDTKGQYYMSGLGWSGLAITKNCANPEAAIKFIAYLYTDEGQRLAQWGREGIEWTEGPDGFPIFNDEWMEASKDENVLYTKYNPAFYFGTSAAVEATGRIAVLPEDYRAVYNTFKPLLKVCPWITYAEPKGDSDEKVIYKKLEDMYQNSEVKVFLSSSEEEFEKNFEEYMANARQIGVDKLEAYMNENIGAARDFYK